MSDHLEPRLDVLADPRFRQRVWREIAGQCAREVFTSGKPVYWCKAYRQARGYARAEDPPREWPNGNPAWKVLD